jgi:diacylglycerol kinase family enzyme
MRKVRVLINPKSGIGTGSGAVLKAIREAWDTPENDLTFQFSLSAEDGITKPCRAVSEGVHTVLVAGGDGMINTIGSVLVGTDVELGVIPAGSGNGFARHFNLSLDPAKAAAALTDARPAKIDVGRMNNQPFFVTCSMAWDAALVRTFEKFPIRGPMPYILAGVYELFEYTPQPFEVEIDGAPLELEDAPMVFTAANLTQFGNNARIAPNAEASDGHLELVYIYKRDVPKAIANFHRFFDGTLNRLPEVYSRSFKTLQVTRSTAGPVQVDGELVNAPAKIRITVKPDDLTVLVPPQPAEDADA